MTRRRSRISRGSEQAKELVRLWSNSRHWKDKDEWYRKVTWVLQPNSIHCESCIFLWSLRVHKAKLRASGKSSMFWANIGSVEPSDSPNVTQLVPKYEPIQSVFTAYQAGETLEQTQLFNKTVLSDNLPKAWTLNVCQVWNHFLSDKKTSLPLQQIIVHIHIFQYHWLDIPKPQDTSSFKI